MRYTLLLLLITLSSCKHEKLKYLQSTYPSGKPKLYYYFDSKEDADQLPIVHIKDGIGTVNKPLTFGVEYYYENGKLMVKGQYINGQTSGLWQYYYEDGVHQARSYYLNGLGKDSVYCWYPDGKLKRLLIEIDTLKHYWHGTDYFENSNKLYDYGFFMGTDDHWLMTGPWAEWFEDGKQKFRAELKSGSTIGKWQKWDSLGNLQEGDSTINVTSEFENF
ncbi:MAG: hypothetical protein JST68_03980 [Bacteroidetes bacterium]|nr:hypothetical protein [Bacteroidota bacterium]